MPFLLAGARATTAEHAAAAVTDGIGLPAAAAPAAWSKAIGWQRGPFGVQLFQQGCQKDLLPLGLVAVALQPVDLVNGCERVTTDCGEVRNGP